MNNETLFIARKLRESRGSTPQKRVSQLSGISQSVISRIESGMREPTAVELKKLADLFDKSITYFFRKEKESNGLFSEDDLYQLVKYYSRDLLARIPPSRLKEMLTVEETVIAILKVYPKAYLLTTIPALLYFSNIDTFDLYNGACRDHLQNRLGFIIDMAIECFKDRKVKKQLDQLAELKEELGWVKLAREDSLTENLKTLTPQRMTLLRKIRDPLAARWNMLDSLYLDNFKKGLERATLENAA